MKIKRLMTWCKQERKLRLFRIIWERGTVGDGKGYSAMFSVSLLPKLFSFERGDLLPRIRLVLLGLSLHYKRSYGGRFV